MRNLLAAALVGLLASAASAQIDDLVLSFSEPGTHYVRIDVSQSGTITVRKIDNVVRLGAPADPGDPGQPGGGDIGSDLAKVAHDTIPAKDPEADSNAQRLEIAYTTLARYIGSEFKRQTGDTPWQQLSDATAKVRDEVLGEAAPLWSVWVSSVGAELGRLEDAGDLEDADQMRRAYRQIAEGLAYSPNEARKRLSPETRALILQIIRLILETFLSQQAAHVAPALAA